MWKSYPSFLILGVFLPLYGLEENKNTRSPRPRQVTLQASAQPLDKVLESIENETKIRVEASPEIAELPVSISLEEANFWPALDARASSIDLMPTVTAARAVIRVPLPCAEHK